MGKISKSSINRLVLLVDISNSGKSTYCSSLIHSNPEINVRVNRDKIREMLFSYTEKEIVLFDISLEEAKDRNSSRDRQVPEEILENQYKDYQNIKSFLTKNELKFNYICTKEK